MRVYQTTIAEDFTIEGIGVHGGQATVLTFTPASPDYGIVFSRKDSHGIIQYYPALSASVGSTDLSTALGPKDNRIYTIEHLMSAMSALGLDNVNIEVSGPEVPILDGSAIDFYNQILAVGLIELTKKRKYIKISRAVRYEHRTAENSLLGWAEFLPFDGQCYEVDIEFSIETIGRQSCKLNLTADEFVQNIAPARTFGFMKDVENLWAAGLALGSSLENSIVIGLDNEIINPDGLRYPDEFVRHKMLDAIGDLALMGHPFIGCFRSYKGGHKMNSEIAKKLMMDKDAYEIIELDA